MAQTAQVSFRIDDDVKRSAESVLNDLGLTMSAAITVFLKKVGREHRIPFELSADPFYSESNIRYLESVKKDIDEGRAHFAEHDDKALCLTGREASVLSMALFNYVQRGDCPDPESVQQELLDIVRRLDDLLASGGQP